LQNEFEELPNFGGNNSKSINNRLSYHNLDGFTKLSTHQETTSRKIDYD